MNRDEYVKFFNYFFPVGNEVWEWSNGVELPSMRDAVRMFNKFYNYLCEIKIDALIKGSLSVTFCSPNYLEEKFGQIALDKIEENKYFVVEGPYYFLYISKLSKKKYFWFTFMPTKTKQKQNELVFQIS